MAKPASLPISDTLRAAQGRGLLPTSLDTAGLRDLDVGLRARSVFVARGTNAIFLSHVKDVADKLAAGDIGLGQARTALREVLKALNYTPEGGFPGDEGEVPPALRGTLQDLSSFRRLDLIVRTQLELMRGAGQQMRFYTPERLAGAPALELVRIMPKDAPRDWHARWVLAGGTLLNGRMIAAKGDPIWGELGSSQNFNDALDVDHPPFAFNSGMGWDERTVAEWKAAGMTEEQATEVDDLMRNPKRPRVILGTVPLPTPQLSMKDVAPELVGAFVKQTGAIPEPEKPGQYRYADILKKSLAKRAAAKKAGGGS